MPLVGLSKLWRGDDMKFVSILVVIAAVWQLIAVNPTYAGASPARTMAVPGLATVPVQSSGSVKIQKECQVKGTKQGLRGLSLEAYVEECKRALEFNTKYAGAR